MGCHKHIQISHCTVSVGTVDSLLEWHDCNCAIERQIVCFEQGGFLPSALIGEYPLLSTTISSIVLCSYRRREEEHLRQQQNSQQAMLNITRRNVLAKMQRDRDACLEMVVLEEESFVLGESCLA